MAVPSVVVEVPGLQGPPGPAGAGLTVIAHHDVDGDYAYLGVAAPETLDSDEAWTITRINLSAPVGEAVEARDVAWNDRLTAVYE